MPPRNLRTLLLLLLAFCAAPLVAQDEPAEEPSALPQQEVIRSYHSAIAIQPGGSMRVTETIRVVALGEHIRRGIYRDFPTDYRDQWGNRVRVGFTFRRALRNGREEPWRTESLDNGVRVYVGDKDVFLQPGEYTYELSYETDRQLGFFADHDELYWNVTGNGWGFPIERATAEVTLPRSVAREQVTITAFTGAQGSTAQEFTGEVDAGGVSRFATTRALEPYEGLTIVVGFPKGLVPEPTTEQKLRYFAADNAPVIAALIGFLVVLVYQYLAWSAVGRDPQAGTVVVQYEPPQRFSPAEVRFLDQMGFDDKTFAALAVSMAVKGYLTIEQDGEGTFTLRKRAGGSRSELSPEEQRVANELFAGGDSIKLEQANHARMQAALKALKEQLARKLEKTYFVTNSKWVIPSIALTALTYIAVVVSAGGEGMAVGGFMSIWLSLWTFGVIMLGKAVVAAWRLAWHSRGLTAAGRFGGAIFLTLFATPFFVGEVVGLGVFAIATSVPATIILFAAGVSNYVFYHLLKAPTSAGRALLDKLEGFKEFLGATEDADRRYAIDRSPATFEKFLPYAMALDLEEQWSRKFESVLAAAAAAGGTAAAAYSPSWGNFSSGGWRSFSSGAFSSSFSSAISSSSTPPGRSSGFSGGGGGGGGGSSGGGGGGGGGGGW